MILRLPPPVTTNKLDISLLLGSHDEEKEAKSAATGGDAMVSPRPSESDLAVLPRPLLSTASPEIQGEPLVARPGSSTKRPLSDVSPRGRPAKKQSKWSPEENALILELRGSGMKWDDISKRIPGRSPISCRLHYQNYLERRCEWDEDRKNRLARLIKLRFKEEMWSRIAEEMAIPWRAAEAMHWQLGETEMAQRAGVTPFSFSTPPQTSPRLRRNTLSRRDRLSTSQLPSLAELTAGIPAYSPHLTGEPPFAMGSPMFHPESNPVQGRRGSRSRARR